MILRHNNITYYIDEGSTYIENYNETLNSANVRLSRLYSATDGLTPITTEIDIEPFDDVYLAKDIDDQDGKYLCVYSYTQSQIGLDAGGYYEYSITLFSQTKKLENYVLPNVSITPRKVGTPLSIYAYMQQYLSEYGPTTWSFAASVLTKFGGITVPEMQWNNPTLRDVLNDLMMTQDCIVTLSNNVISYIDISTTTGSMSTTGINYIEKSQSGDEYCSDVRMEMTNVMQTTVGGINNVVTTCEYLPFASSQYLANTDNVLFETKFPILNIKHLWLIVFASETNGSSTKLMKIDLCNLPALSGVDSGGSLVFESKEFEALNVNYRTIAFNNLRTTPISDLQKKNYAVYYTRGSKSINNFNNSNKGQIGPFENQTYEWLKAIAYSRCSFAPSLGFNDINHSGDSGSLREVYFNTFFQAEYETTYNAAFIASKDNAPRNKRTIIDNQTNSWVDAYSQGFLEYQKVNRMGNKQIMINQRVTGNQNPIAIGQLYNNNKIVYRTEYQYYVDHTEVNAWLTENYVLQNYFTGVKQRIRTWVNAQDEAFIRHDVKKYRINLSYTNGSSTINTMFGRFGQQLDSNNKNISNIRYAMVTTDKTSNYYLFDCVSRLIGESLVFTTGFNDNWVAGKHVEIGTNSTQIRLIDILPQTTAAAGFVWVSAGIDSSAPAIIGSSGATSIPLNTYGYTDSNGEFESITINFGIGVDGYDLSDGYQFSTDDEYRQMMYECYGRPKLDDSSDFNGLFNKTYTLHKDNKEIPIISTQFEYRSTDDDLLITKNFLKYISVISTQTVALSGLSFYHSSVLQDTLPSGATQDSTVSLSYGTTDAQQTYTYTNSAHASGYCYVCVSSEVLLVFKYNSQKVTNIYFNNVEDR